MTTEVDAKARPGGPMLVGGILALVLLVAGLIGAASQAERLHNPRLIGSVVVVCLLGILADVFVLRGLVIVSPNFARVVTLFGKYVGTIKTPGLWWVNPLTMRGVISLRTRNMVTPTIKVNDVRGNPIEIGAVVVWRVIDSARASFDVDNFKTFVDTQCESALRHLASVYPYDAVDSVLSLRGSTDQVSKSLSTELQERVAQAGIAIEETRLSHLAYAPEIAGAMLRLQQADAVVAARFRIVEGAVGMVESALEHLEKGGKITLDEERKAAMVSNLMVVLCGDHGVQPVVNTGTLYNG